jgi:hypothetical protein
MMPHIEHLFKHAAMLKVLAANIRDGEKLGLHPDNHFAAVASDVRAGLNSRKRPEDISEEDYLIEFEEVCYGNLPQRAGSIHLLRCETALPDETPEWYTCVITVSHWTKYLSTAAIDQLSQAAGITLPFVPMGGADDPALYKILATLRSGEFTPKHDFSLGFPLVWITPRPEFERRMLLHANRADAARDYLGLVHREENEHLIAIHIPSAAVKQKRSARPVFSDAGRHRRFMVMPGNKPPMYPQPWGQTLDLEFFESEGTLGVGAAERVCDRIDAASLSGTRMPFEYLGRLQTTRGRSAATDIDYARLQEESDLEGYTQIVQNF